MKKATTLKKVANPSLDFELGENSVINALPYENVVKVEGNVFNPGLVAYSKGLTMSRPLIRLEVL